MDKYYCEHKIETLEQIDLCFPACKQIREVYMDTYEL